MKYFSRGDFEQLVEHRSPRCLSILMPTHRAGGDVQQNPIRLKNLLGKAEEELVGVGVRPAEAREMLAGASRLIEDLQFWSHQGDGLALFVSPEHFSYHTLPLELEQRVVVAPRFHLKPLLPVFSGDGRFLVLAISQNALRLLQCTRHSSNEVRLADAPQSLEEAMRFEDPEKQVQYHTRTAPPGHGGKRPAMFHGQGGIKDWEKDAIARYFRDVDRGVHRALDGDNAPLVLAGVGYLLSIYKDVNTYPYLQEKVVTGNRERVRTKDSDLRDEAWTIVEPLFRKERERARSRYETEAGTGRTSSEVDDVVRAAAAGRVDQLFVATDTVVPGRYSDERDEVHVEDELGPDKEDLLNVAALLAFRSGAGVHAVPSSEVPGGSKTAAVLRY